MALRRNPNRAVCPTVLSQVELVVIIVLAWLAQVLIVKCANTEVIDGVALVGSELLTSC